MSVLIVLEAATEGAPDLGSYIGGLTPVLLRGDTRVTNHGFADGRATPMQSVLQAGTAVLVDGFGVPRARCACGNPLLPPRAVPSTPTYQGQPWPGFSPANVTVVNASTTVINVITVVDVGTGQPFGRPTGPQAGPDVAVPGATGATLPPVTGPPGTRPATTARPGTTAVPGGSGPFTLVDVTHTVSELVASWTVDPRAGTARFSIPAGSATYSWTVPDRLDPVGTRLTWAGSSVGNVNAAIGPSGEGIVFDSANRDISVTGGQDQKSAVMTVPSAAREVKLRMAMGFSVTAVYTYRR